MDKLSPQQRHTNMAAIRSKDTKPEMIVRRGLWKRGFRYRLNHKRLPGHPDLVLRKYRTCIFVNGCFWHGHGLHGCRMNNFRGNFAEWRVFEIFFSIFVAHIKQHDYEEVSFTGNLCIHCLHDSSRTKHVQRLNRPESNSQRMGRQDPERRSQWFTCHYA